MNYTSILLILIIWLIIIYPIYAVPLKDTGTVSDCDFENTYDNIHNEKKVEDFIIYYGEIDNTMIDKLSKYSLVIIEPRHITKKQVLDLKSNNVKVLGYTSVVEQNENDMEFLSLENEWFYKPHGKKIRIDKWQSWYMDIRNKEYQSFLLEQIYLHIISKELDGVFLDTVGDIDDLDWDHLHKKQMREQYKEFLKRLKNNYKELEIVQNWGFYTAKNYSYKLIDGIMWEGFTFELVNRDKWCRDRYNEIKSMDVDFYIVTPHKTKQKDKEFKKKTYVYNRNSDIYDDIN